MLDDPDLVPFDPPARFSLRALRRNFVEAFPRSTYEQAVTRIRGPLNDTLMICDPDLIHEMLVQRPEVVGRDAITRRIFAPVLGDTSIFVSEGDDWRWKRRAVMPTFRHETLLSSVPVMAAMAARQVERWRGGRTDAPIDIAPSMLRTMFEIVVGTMLGAPADLDDREFGRAMTDAFEAVPWQTILGLFAAPAWIPFPGQRCLRRARDYAYSEVGRIVAARRLSPTTRSDLLDVLVAARDPDTGRAMTDAELVTNLVTFISTGHEVSAQALTWTLWLIAKDQDTQGRILDETMAIAGTKPIEPGHIEALGFTQQVLKESMRLFPPAAILLRQAKGDMTLGNHRVRAGTHLHVPIFSLHRHVRLWDNPNRFDPDRFAPQQAKAHHRYAYMPFGAGPRVCVGASFSMIETTVVLASLVRAFRFRPVPGHKPTPIARISLRVKDGMPLFIEPR
jgi:cytochrome P450